MPFFSEAGLWLAGEAAKRGANALYNERNVAISLMTGAWRRLFVEKTVVVISGLGGAGKSTIQKIISGEKKLNDLDPIYVLSTDNELTHVKGKYFVKLWTAPGQPKGIKINESEITTQLMSANKIIFISVVTYGYNALHQIDLGDMKEYSSTKSLQEIADDYFEDQRKEEILRLRKFCTTLEECPAGKKIEVLTVVNKSDLWWSQRHAVQKHYADSEYSKIIEKLIDSKSASFARHTMVSVCLMLLNVRTSDGKILAHPSPGFDVISQKRNFDNFAETTGQFLKSV